jgi:hypothetical protein
MLTPAVIMVVVVVVFFNRVVVHWIICTREVVPSTIRAPSPSATTLRAHGTGWTEFRGHARLGGMLVRVVG